jgi:hypothetical protein
MPPNDIRRFVTNRPFRPFRLTLTDGRTYEIGHPELAMVGRSTVIVGLPAPDESEPIYDGWVEVSLLHIMQIEPIGASTERSQPGNETRG